MFTPRELELERGWPGRVDGDASSSSPRRRCRRSSPAAAARASTPSTRSPTATCSRRCCYPPTVRVFSPFERRETPFFSFRSTVPGARARGRAALSRRASEELDYGLALAAMIGADGAIGGFTLANDWTARDLAARRARGRVRALEEQRLRALARPGARHAGRAARDRGSWRASTGRSAAASTLRELVHRWAELVAACGAQHARSGPATCCSRG